MEGLLYRYLVRRTSGAEDREVYAWLEASEKNRSLFFEVAAVWSAHRTLISPATGERCDAMLRRLNARIDADDAMQRPARLAWRRWMSAAAAAAVVVIVVAAVFSLFVEKTSGITFIMGACMSSVVCILGIIIELLSPDSSLFWSFFALNLDMLLLSYAPVFPAFLRLREIDPDSERPFRVPGGRGMLRVLAYVPMALILISIFFTAVPLSLDSETLSSYLPITIGSILSIVIGEILIAARARRHHS